MNWLDIVILVVILISCLFGIRTGFILQAANILALILGIVAAGQFHHLLAAPLGQLIASDRVASFIAYIVIFLMVVIALRIAAYILRAMLAKIRLQSIDRVLGGCIGALKGVLICGALLWGVVHLYQPSQQSGLAVAAQKSLLSPIVLQSMYALEAALPSECRAKIRLFLREADKRTGRVFKRLGSHTPVSSVARR